MERLSFSNESAEYRAARNKLLEAEIKLRRQIEDVAGYFPGASSGHSHPIDALAWQ